MSSKKDDIYAEIHKGHRERMKKRFLSTGFDEFASHESLEVILYYAVPRIDTNPMAHGLLRKFGSLSAILDAPYDALRDFGLTDNACVFLKLLPEIARLYLDDKHNNKDKIVDYDNLGDFMVKKFIGREDECCILLLIDAKGKEVFCGTISKGSFNSTDLPVRTAVNYALKYNASRAVLAHNHPSGVALPSKADIYATKKFSTILDTISVLPLDHFIIADGDFLSIASCGFECGLFLETPELVD